MAQATTSTGAESVRWDLTDLFASPTDPKLDSALADALQQAKAFESAYKGKVASLAPPDFARMMAQL